MTQVNNEIYKQFQLHETDKGSSGVQVVALTDRIKMLIGHSKLNHKDYSSKCGLIKLVSQRRKHLDYLKRTKPEVYTRLLQVLKLRK